jgi:hypothetical protein
MITDTRYVHIEGSIIMKGLEHATERALDEADEKTLAHWAAQRAPLRQLAYVLVAAVVLACIHRGISGVTEGSVIALLNEHVRDLLHHLASDLSGRSH